MTAVERWLEKNAAYYEAHPNEPIYAHVLLKAMKTIAEDLHGNETKATGEPPASQRASKSAQPRRNTK